MEKENFFVVSSLMIPVLMLVGCLYAIIFDIQPKANELALAKPFSCFECHSAHSYTISHYNKVTGKMEVVGEYLQ